MDMAYAAGGSEHGELGNGVCHGHPHPFSPAATPTCSWPTGDDLQSAAEVESGDVAESSYSLLNGDAGIEDSVDGGEQVEEEEDEELASSLQCNDSEDSEKDGDQQEDEEDEEDFGIGRDLRTRKSSSVRRAGVGRRSRGRTSADGEPAFPSSGGRHKTGRRRHQHHPGSGKTVLGLSQVARRCRRVMTDSVCPWCLSYVRLVAELVVFLAHRCGEWVEVAAATIYSSATVLLLKVSDLQAMRTGAGTVLRQAGAVAQVLAALGSRGVYATMLLSGGRGRHWWAWLSSCRLWCWVTRGWQKLQDAFCRSRTDATSSSASYPADTPRGFPGQELERLLALSKVPEEELDPFAVLGVEPDAADPELKRAYRQLAVLVHPDKNKHPSAGEAFKVLRAAWDIVSNPETRREYQLKRMAEMELSKSMNEFLSKLQDDLKEAMNTMMCTRCEGKHKRFEMERDSSQARFCAECNKHHSAEEGDLWAESSLLGLRITYFAFIDGKVYDITEWAGCQRISISPDTHRVPYHISFSSKNNSSATRHKASSEPPPPPASPADLQDFFSRIFHAGNGPNGMAPNGGFFSPPPPPAPPGSAAPFMGSPPSTGPPGPQAPRADTVRPRRKKKVRRAFQR